MNDLDNGTLDYNKYVKAAHAERARAVRAFFSRLLASLTSGGSSKPKTPAVHDGAAG